MTDATPLYTYGSLGRLGTETPLDGTGFECVRPMLLRHKRRPAVPRFLPRTRSWTLRVVAVVASIGQAALGALLGAACWTDGRPVLGASLALAMLFLSVSTWRLRFWAMALTLGVIGAATFLSVFAFFPVFGFDEGSPGPSVQLQLARWLAFEAACLAILEVGTRHRNDLVRSL
jgi:hypothetical protein